MIRLLLIIGLVYSGIVQTSAQSFPFEVKQGKLTYNADERGNRLPDYSYCGYRASEKPIPDVSNVVFVPRQEGDCSEIIQDAIDYVASLAPDKRTGFRGAVLLDKGTFVLRESLRIPASGIVLRGMHREETVLKKIGTERSALLYMEGVDNRRITDTLSITDGYIPVNAAALSFSGSSAPAKGERVLILRPSSKEWIASIGCDIYGGGISALGWKPGEADLLWDRTVVSATNNRLVLDAPLTAAIDSQREQPLILRYEWSGRISECGVENMTLISDYNRNHPKDEAHCWTGISIEHAENCWVRMVNFKHFAGSAVMVQPTGSKITVEDCKSTEPISEIGGMRRQTFHTLGQQTLFQRCYSRQGINDFSAGYCAPGPNAFVQCEAEESLGFSGSVGSWACGLLFDIVDIDGHNLTFKNLGQEKNGTGWNAANSMFWQCTAAEIECFSPAEEAPNHAYGCWAQFSGNGYWGESNNHVQPRSLFYAQLQERLGKDCTAQARILPRATNATSSPTVEAAMKMAQEAYTPRLTLAQWIDEAVCSAPLGSEKLKRATSGSSLSPRHGKQNIAAQSGERKGNNGGIRVEKGVLLFDGSVLTGGKHDIQWWSGKLRNNYLRQAKPHITRFVPGREGNGLTDRIDSTVNYMTEKHIAVLDHNYGLWYERRRDDHERIRRRDGDVWAPFYEQPFARSGNGTAWDGLSRYDLSQPNQWYWGRLREFAVKGEDKGLILFHQHYFQHNILEAGAHWVDSPWRSINNVNETGFPEPVPFAGDKRIFIADMFYDVEHPVRRQLHRQYIRQCLDNLADCPNVIHSVSAEYTGPLHFVRFWLDVIAEWKQETGKRVLIALSTTKDVQDTILNEPHYASMVDIIDIRYWHYKTDGIFAPEGGKNMAPRQHMRQMKTGKTTFREVYMAVSEYRTRFPEKAVTYYAQNYPSLGWAVFMGGGSCPQIQVSDPGFLKAAAQMTPQDGENGNYRLLVNSDTGCIIYSHSAESIPVPLTQGKYRLKLINPSNGQVQVINKQLKADGEYKLLPTEKGEKIYWFEKLL